jgi:hypothetical protein
LLNEKNNELVIAKEKRKKASKLGQNFSQSLAMNFNTIKINGITHLLLEENPKNRNYISSPVFW